MPVPGPAARSAAGVGELVRFAGAASVFHGGQAVCLFHGGASACRAVRVTVYARPPGVRLQACPW